MRFVKIMLVGLYVLVVAVAVPLSSIGCEAAEEVGEGIEETAEEAHDTAEDVAEDVEDAADDLD